MRNRHSVDSFLPLVCFGLTLCSCGAAAAAAPRNLLPNASFELGWGEGPLQTHWADYQNALTIKLTSRGQWPRNNRPWPEVKTQDGAPDGTHVAEIPTDKAEGGVPDGGHLPSAVLKVKPGQAYTLSVYARSDEPSAKIQLTLWTRMMDYTARPDVFSAPMGVTREWKRYKFSFVVEDLMDIAVVDLVARADKPANVQVDAVQFEEGALATAFQTRYPVEAVLLGKRKAIGLHFMNEPLVVHMTVYNSTKSAAGEGMKLKIEQLFGGEHLMTKPVGWTVPPGVYERKITIEPAPLGRWRARLVDALGEDIGADNYPFVVHPVMDKTFQGVLYSLDGRVRKIPAQRVILPWTNKKNWYADPPGLLAITKDHKIYVQLNDGRVGRTTDGGKTWKIIEIDAGHWGVHGVLKDGTWLRPTLDRARGNHDLDSSKDEGKTWQRLGVLRDVGDPQVGPITELADGTLIWPVGYSKPGIPFTCHAYISKDRGKTWSRPYPICPGGEPAIVQLNSGKLMAITRHNPSITGEYLNLPIKNYDAWRFWQRHRRGRDLTSYVKRVLVAHSADGGMTWGGVHAGSRMLDDMHGGLVPLPDGRVVLHHTHRFPIERGGEWAWVSRDGGHTWDKGTYYLNATRAYPGYAASCVLPPELADGKKGMILTLVGERSVEGSPAMMQAIRWRPLP